MLQETFSDWGYGRIRERLLMYKLCQEAKHNQQQKKRDKLLKQIKKESGKDAFKSARSDIDDGIRSHRYAWLDVVEDIITSPTNNLEFPDLDALKIKDTKTNRNRGKYWPLSERDIKNFCVGVARKTRNKQPYRSYKPLESLIPVFKDFLIAGNYLTESDLLEPYLWSEPKPELEAFAKKQALHGHDQSARKFDGDYRSKRNKEKLALDHYASFSFVKDQHWHRVRYVVNGCPIALNEDYTRWRIEDWKRKRAYQKVFFGWCVALSEKAAILFTKPLADKFVQPIHLAISETNIAENEKDSFHVDELNINEFEAVINNVILESTNNITKNKSGKPHKFQRLIVKNLTEFLEIDRIENQPLGRYRFVLPEDTERGDSLLRRLIAKFKNMNEFNETVKTDFFGRPAPDYVQVDLSTLDDPNLLAKRMFWDVHDNCGLELDEILKTNVNINYFYGVSPGIGGHILHCAAEGKAVGMLEKLIEKEGIDHLIKDSDGLLASQVAMQFVDSFEIGERLMEREIEQAVERGIDPETLYKVGEAAPAPIAPSGPA